jgi:hypothetical protein
MRASDGGGITVNVEDITEQHIATAARLFELRESARAILGDNYRSHMEELGRVLKIRAADQGKDVISVLAGICAGRELTGLPLMMVMAAAVEIVEPS